MTSYDPRPPAPPSGTPVRTAVRISDLHKSYPAGATPVHAVRGVSLTLAQGSFTAVMGPSGSGKSTLLSCAAGLDTPTRGQVVVGDRDISTLKPDDLTRFRREHVGFVFQAYNLIDHLPVVENVTLPTVLAGHRPDTAWLAHLVAVLGLTGMEQRLPGELSGGQAQRVAIARALFTRPDVVLADEPTGALDSRTATEVLQAFRATARELGQTVVVVTHDPQVAVTADRVLFLADGLLVDQVDRPTPAQVAARMMELGR
jgi:putative ABC transport system ATP-binding protein